MTWLHVSFVFREFLFLAQGYCFFFLYPRITFAWSPSIISCSCLAVLMFVCPHSFGVSYLHVAISAPLRIYIFTYLHAYILSLFPYSVFSYYPTNLFWVPEINCYDAPYPTVYFCFPSKDILQSSHHVSMPACFHTLISTFRHAYISSW